MCEEDSGKRDYETEKEKMARKGTTAKEKRGRQKEKEGK